MTPIKKYIDQSQSIAGLLSFLVLWYARTRPLNGRAPVTRILHFFYPSLKLTSKKFKGLILTIDPADFGHVKITDEFFFDNVYQPEKVNFKPECIIDCGAHIGMFTLLASSYFPGTKIYCFEPNQKNVLFIKKQIAINNLDDVTLIEAAVSDFEGKVQFDNSQVSFGGYINKDSNTASSPTVQVINLLSFIKKLDLKNLVLKIDIEGEEKTLLPLLVKELPFDCVIFFEYHFGLAQFEGLKTILEESGFDVKINRVTDQLYIDAVAVRSSVE